MKKIKKKINENWRERTGTISYGDGGRNERERAVVSCRRRLRRPATNAAATVGIGQGGSGGGGV